MFLLIMCYCEKNFFIFCYYATALDQLTIIIINDEINICTFEKPN